MYILFFKVCNVVFKKIENYLFYILYKTTYKTTYKTI